METVAWIGFSQALFTGFLIAAKKNRSVSDTMLASWLFLIAFEFGTYGIDLQVFKNNVTLSNPFFLFNPAIYLYACSLTNKKFSLKWIQLLHLIPYIIFEGLAYLLREKMEVVNFFKHDSTFLFRMAFMVASSLSWVIYSMLSVIKVHIHRIHLKDEFSTLDSYKRISWLLFVLIVYILYWLGTVILGVMNYLKITDQVILNFSYSFLLALLYLLGFYGLKQELIFYENHAEKASKNNKYKYSRLQEKYKKELKKKILGYFEKEKPYLDSELTIGKLSERLNVSRHVVTEVLNTVFNKNFYQFVNEYRVDAVKQMLSGPKKNILSIEAIGYECGFNSKSTFFSVFKNLTGKTPMQYKDDIV